MTTIKLKNGSGAPAASDLVQGEPAFDLTNKRLYTEDSGGNVIEVGTNPTSVTTGVVTATSLDISGDIDVDGTTNLDAVDIDGAVDFASTTSHAGNASFADNAKAIFGAGNDLQIYHSGSHSFITDAGTGDLYIGASNNIALMNAAFSENKLLATTDGALTLYYDGSAKLATTSTGIDVTGTVTADDLDVQQAGFTSVLVGSTNASGSMLILDGDSNGDGSGGDYSYVYHNTDGQLELLQNSASGTDEMLFKTAGNNLRMKIGSGGDVSLYEDTGTTAKFFWDASAESLGIGTSSPSNTIHVERNVSGDWLGRFRNTNTTNGYGLLVYAGDDSSVQSFKVANHAGSGDYFVVRGDGNVGIGTSSPAASLSIAGSSTGEYDALILRNGNSAASGQSTAIIFEASAGTIGDEAASVAKISGLRTGAGSKGDLLFHTTLAGVSSEKMRIDSSGNLLVGKTSTSSAIAGTTLWAGGYLNSTVDSDYVARFNRLTSDGEIVQLQKDSTTVGSIGTSSSSLYIGKSSGAGLMFQGGNMIPVTDGSAADDTYDLGASGVRFDDVYATNGTIQTSDRNEKQDIAELSEAEQRVAVACKGLLRKFCWKSSVADKGDEARIHFGIIAQDLQAAFEAEGLDAGRYAMFISTTWTDEDTGEERTRMGVRYSELLAFIIAAI